MEHTKTEELRPCPFCGTDEIAVLLFDPMNQGSYEETHGVQCQHCFDLNSPSINEWQNAYCWKQLDQSQQTIKELLEAAEYFRSLVDADLLDSLARNGNPYMDAIAKASKPRG